MRVSPKLQVTLPPLRVTIFIDGKSSPGERGGGRGRCTRRPGTPPTPGKPLTATLNVTLITDAHRFSIAREADEVELQQKGKLYKTLWK